MKLADLKTSEFVDLLASDAPAPGGGSAAALEGALGAALTAMVCSLTVGKKKYADVQELVEAARIDGASYMKVLIKIVLPLSLPILATVGLMTGLGYWNNWTNGLYYITDTRLYSLQQYLKSIIDNIMALANMDVGSSADMPSISIRMAIAVVGTVPILLLYPFFQKAFVAGIALGGVKE